VRYNLRSGFRTENNNNALSSFESFKIIYGYLKKKINQPKIIQNNEEKNLAK